MARANNRMGVAGVCPGCKLMVLKVLDKDIRADVSLVIEVGRGGFGADRGRKTDRRSTTQFPRVPKYQTTHTAEKGTQSSLP